VSKRDSLPRYLEIQRDLQARIASGDWPPGHRVPAEHELQERYGCSRMTVNKALSALANAGLIVRKRRSGSYVAAPKSQESILEIHDIKAEILATGSGYRFEILSRDERQATEEDAERLGIRARASVLALAILHFAADRPYAMEERLINLIEVPNAAGESFAASPPGTWLLDLIPWTEAEHTIRADLASPSVARRLDIAKHAACLIIERRTWQADKTLTWVRLTYPGERHRLVSLFRPGSDLGP
jgi:GntR family histidine utilization transcriptional repressor